MSRCRRFRRHVEKESKELVVKMNMSCKMHCVISVLIIKCIKAVKMWNSVEMKMSYTV